MRKEDQKGEGGRGRRGIGWKIGGRLRKVKDEEE